MNVDDSVPARFCAGEQPQAYWHIA